jgi:hypothetical protein
MVPLPLSRTLRGTDKGTLSFDQAFERDPFGRSRLRSYPPPPSQGRGRTRAVAVTRLSSPPILITRHVLSRELMRQVRRYEPCLPRPAKEPPAGPGWIHEIKHDGFRILAELNAGGCKANHAERF